MSKIFTFEEIKEILNREHWPIVNRWLQRGDGVAVYGDRALETTLGGFQFVSYGSPSAQIESAEPPRRMPDIGSAINWRYLLEGVYRGEPLK